MVYKFAGCQKWLSEWGKNEFILNMIFSSTALLYSFKQLKTTEQILFNTLNNVNKKNVTSKNSYDIKTTSGTRALYTLLARARASSHRVIVRSDGNQGVAEIASLCKPL